MRLVGNQKITLNFLNIQKSLGQIGIKKKEVFRGQFCFFFQFMCCIQERLYLNYYTQIINLNLKEEKKNTLKKKNY